MRALLIPAAAASILAFTAPSPSSAPPPLDDATVVGILDATNTLDIQAGQMALQKSQAQAVRDLAQQFIHDHKAVQQQGQDLARRLGLTPKPPEQFVLADQQAKAMAELQTKSGAAFDQAFARNEVTYHQAVLDYIDQTLLPAIQNEDLKAFVEQIGPSFKGHLEAAKQLEKTLQASS
jgi:putative membrane protein